MGTSKLKELRKRIDQLDQKILSCISKRGTLAQKVGAIKNQSNIRYHVPEREAILIRRLLTQNKGPYPKWAIESIFREIISASLALEAPIRVAFLGPEGTFTHCAAQKMFGSSCQFVAQRNIKSVFEEVAAQRVEYGIVPIENSSEGAVNLTLDLFMEFPLIISGEKQLPIHQNLLASFSDLKKIKNLYSHDQAFAQCRRWIETNLPSVKLISISSTAKAAEVVKKEKNAAAISSLFAAKYYQLKVLKKNIEDFPNNYTRFWVIGKYGTEPTGDDKTSIMLSAKDEVGILSRILKIFEQENINLTKVESRPSKQKIWEYVFFMDLDGHAQDKKIADALDRTSRLCHFLRVLGSYPKGNA